MNPVLLIHAVMAVLLILFRHKVDNGNYGIGHPHSIPSGPVQGNRTYAMAIYNPDVFVPGLPLVMTNSGASK